jgi:hypothetical protein
MPTQAQELGNDLSSAAATAGTSNMPTGPFEHLPDAIPVLRDFEIRQKLLQWNLSDSLQLQRFRVHRKLRDEADEALLMEFFQDESVHRALSVRGKTCTILLLRYFMLLVLFLPSLASCTSSQQLVQGAGNKARELRWDLFTAV